MSDNAIRVGDLVAVVKPTVCCRRDDSVGHVHTVLGSPPHAWTRCHYCGHIRSAAADLWVSGDWQIEAVRLRRIPPLGELDEAERKQKETA